MPFPDEHRPVVVVEYRPQWPEEFVELASRLRGALGELAVAIDHIGSTSVPGLPAKDCIDVQMRVRSIDEVRTVPLLAAIGFRCRPESWNRSEISGGRRCSKLVFAPPVGARSCNVHVRLGCLRADQGSRHRGPDGRGRTVGDRNWLDRRVNGFVRAQRVRTQYEWAAVVSASP
ncbi:GrpB family protein [Streptomyces sp. NPDC091292]|uniref:GrpB family protein n=1 Tax=Streptomyces sp. NPDC091292 TaxID=3365991 RepID=UPI0037F75082